MLAKSIYLLIIARMRNSPRKVRSFVAVTFAFAGLVAGLEGQPSGFEAAAVKANASAELRSGIQLLPGGRLRAVNVPVRQLLGFAYNVLPFEIEGGPGWLSTTRFDVEATAGRETSQDEMRRMLKELLAERFALRVHQERKEMPLYALMLARSDGRLGQGLRRAAADCAVLAAPGTPVTATTPCGFMGPTPGVPIREAGVAMRGVTMAGLARALTGMVRRPVVDRTGLDGWWDADLGPTAELPPPPPPPGIPDAVVDRADLPSIFSMLPERLGLKLEAMREPSNVLIIDGAMLPGDPP